MNPLSVFIPVYNEEEIIVGNTERLIAYLDTLMIGYEIIIVSNGSTDKTPELGEYLQKIHREVKFACISQKAPGSALKQGLLMASHENIITADMDLSVDMDFIRVANSLLSQGFDLVVGSKRMGTQKRSVMRKIASTAFIISAMLLLGLSFDDYSLAAKAYKKSILEKCLDRLKGGTFYVIEVLYFASRNNYKIVEVPVGCDDNRKSRFNLLHEGLYRFGNLFMLWLKNLVH